MTKFNEQQLQAIQFFEGACGTTASPGSGKSTVLINRIKNLIEVHGEKEQDILAISFTRNTADELKKKLTKMGYPNVNTGTFHSVCSRILFQEGFDVSKLIPQWEVEKCFNSIQRNAEIKDIQSYIGYQKAHCKSYTDKNFVYKESIYTESEMRAFYKAYEELKAKRKWYDLDDYLNVCLDVLQKNKDKYTYKFILVDEHQDSNLVQNLLLKELCPSGNMFVVFDPKQSIFGFRGGNPDYAMNFDKYWKEPTIINMYMNYRSTNNIVQKSNNFIRPYFKNYTHYVDSEANNNVDGDITLNTYFDRESEGVEVVDKIEKLIEDGEKLSEIAVLYRLNSHSYHVENELKKRGIEYHIDNDSSFFKRNEIKAILGYLKLLQNPHDESAMTTVFNARFHPIKFLKKDVLENAVKYSGVNNLSLYEAFITMRHSESKVQRNVNEFESIVSKLRLQLDKDISVVTLISNIVKSFQFERSITDKYKGDELEERLNSIDVLKSFVKGNNLEQFLAYVTQGATTKKKVKKNAVRLMSAHGSKGLEFTHTYVIGTEDSKWPHERSSLDEEARLFYVAVTRAKENLHLSQIGKGESGKGNQFILEYFNNK
ncbi:ATP-dependent helicase [Peribacillus simplex]|uniref:ATP-dependent helicase n=1 Tax=Peribacillus simplex TaxID=1478 RepID=UPI002E1A639E|nr:ATP-dependent helicase [Peribacillus simplex]